MLFSITFFFACRVLAFCRHISSRMLQLKILRIRRKRSPKYDEKKTKAQKKHEKWKTGCNEVLLPSFPYNYCILYKQLNRIGNTILHFATHKLYHTMKKYAALFFAAFSKTFFSPCCVQQIILHSFGIYYRLLYF